MKTVAHATPPVLAPELSIWTLHAQSGVWHKIPLTPDLHRAALCGLRPARRWRIFGKQPGSRPVCLRCEQAAQTEVTE